MKRLSKILFVALLIFSISIDSVLAQENSDEIVEINYYSDVDKSIPIKDSIWRLYKIADIDNSLNDDTINSYQITSLLKEFDVNNPNAELCYSSIFEKKLDESHLDIKSVSEEGEKLKYIEKVTDEHGIIKFENLEYGIYLGVEVRAARNHILADPFIVTVPAQQSTLLPNRQVIYPKAVNANDLVINKKISGNLVNENDVFQIKVFLPKGRYKYLYQNGKEGYITNGDSVYISANNNVTIFDVMADEKYVIKEVVANKLGFRTTYENEEGFINKDSSNICIINNYRHLDQFVNTADFGFKFIMMIVSVVCILISICLVYKKKVNKKRQ